MKGEQSFDLAREASRAQDGKEPKDRAELLFDKIMADVRARKKAGEEISFKFHEDYQNWLNLRNKNIESTPITPAQHVAAKERQQADFDRNPNNRRIDAQQAELEKEQATYYNKRESEAAQVAKEMQESKSFEGYKKPGLDLNRISDKQKTIDSDQVQARELLRKISRESLDLARVGGIIGEMKMKLMDYKAKGEALEEMSGLFNFFKRKNLSAEMDGLQEEIQELFSVLQKEFKMAGAQDKGAKEIMEDAIAKGRINWAMSTAVLAANLFSACAHREQIETPTEINNAPIVREAEVKQQLPDESTRLSAQVAGYGHAKLRKVMESSGTIEGVGNKETKTEEARTYNLKEHSGKLTFKKWQKGIVEEMGTKFDKVNHTETLAVIPNKGAVAEVLDASGKVVASVKLKTGGSSWGAIDKMEEKISALIAKGENPSFRIKDFKDGEPGKVGTAYDADPGLMLGRGAKQSVESKSKVVAPEADQQKTGNKIDHKNFHKKQVEKKSAKELKQEAVLKDAEALMKTEKFKTEHQIGQDYISEEEYTAAIKELENLDYKLEKAHGPILDAKATEEQEKLFNIQTVVQDEIGKLEEAKKELNIKKHQKQIDKEDKIPQAAPAEILKLNVEPRLEDMAGEKELKLRSGKYEDLLVTAFKLASRVDMFSANAKDDIERMSFLEDAKHAKGIYENVQQSASTDGEFPAKDFILKQCEIGLKILEKDIETVKNSLPEREVADVIGSAKDKMDALVERTKSKTGNRALYGEGGVVESMQLIVENAYSSRKLTNADKKKLNKIKKIAHTVLQSENNSESDRSVAKDILDVINTLNKAVSKKDQEEVDVADEAPRSTVRYELPKPMNDVVENKKLSKLLPKGTQKMINDAYYASTVLFDSDKTNDLGEKLVKIGAKLERLLIGEFKAEEIEERIKEMELISEKIRLEIQAGKAFPQKYVEVLDQLDAAILDAKEYMLINNIY
ncbi:MAG: hypothetical protein NT034_01905 [Candidatus Magasanikbacteria bacterium]|nr:hypothetical protein [Candidatus Magasanikbacteria bacterium]